MDKLNPKITWVWLWLSLLAALISGGAWRSQAAELESQERGWELATRQESMPYRLPLAGVNVDLTQYPDEAAIRAELAKIEGLGFIWLRQPFYWSQIEPEPGRFDWGPYDALMVALEAHPDLKLLALIDGTPTWARNPNAPEHPFAPPASPAAYGEFAGTLAQRYGAQIDHYEIWDEPNIREHWGNLDPRPALYVTMLEAAYTGIKNQDPSSMVIMAALAPNSEDGPENWNEVAYLRAIYELGGGDFFDAIAAKPYGFDSPPSDRTLAIGVLNFSRPVLLWEVLLEYGQGHKAVWGGNWGWNSLPPDWPHAPSIWGRVDQATQIRYTAEAFRRAESEWPWAGPLFLQHWQAPAPADDPIQGFAIAPRAELWEGVITEHEFLPPGLYPATVPQAIYTGDWTFSPLGADGGPNADSNTIQVPFYGTEFALQVRKGDYLAYLEVEIDGQPANALPLNREGRAYLPLTSATREPLIDLVLVAEGLSLGEHTALIRHRPDLGDDQYPIVGFAVGQAPAFDQTPGQIALGALILALLSGLVATTRVPWRNLRPPSVASLRNIGDFILGLGLSSLLMLGTVLSLSNNLEEGLRRDWPAILTALSSSALLYYAPSTWLAMIALLLSAIVIFNRPLVGILQVIFWSAFFTSTLDPFFRALFMVEVLLGITLAASAARALYDYARHKRPIFELHPLDFCMAAFVILGAVSLTWAQFFPEALREWRVMLLQSFLFYILLRLTILERGEVALLAETMLFTGFLLSAVGIVLYLSDQNVTVAEGGSRRLLSVYGSPNAVGLMLGRYLPFALAYLLLPVGEWRKILAGIAGGVMLLALALTQSLGAILLGVPAGLGMVILAWRGRRALPLLAGLGAAGAAALIPLSAFIPRIARLWEGDTGTALIRLNLWRSTAAMLADDPVRGAGLDQFLYLYRSRYILPQAWEDPDLSHPHNVILDYWVRLGLAGVVLALLIQYYFWRSAWRAYTQQDDPLLRAALLGTVGAMAAFWAHGLVDMAHFNINLSYIFALLLALVLRVERAAPELHGLAESSNKL